MKNRMGFSLLLALAAACSALLPKSRQSRRLDSYLPENSIRVRVGDLTSSHVSEERFNQLIDQAQAVYGPITQRMGRTLKFRRDWNNDLLNAYASIEEDGTPSISLLGGLARAEGMTPDAMTLVVCHEIGHHLGGAPTLRTLGIDAGRYSDMSVEGEADYFSSLKCARRIFAAYPDDTWIAKEFVDPAAIAICYAQFKDLPRSEICARSIAAGLRLQGVLAQLNAEGLNSVTPVGAVVDLTHDIPQKTDPFHPYAQCRVDTIMAGAICDRGVDDDVDQVDPLKGSCTVGTSVLGSRPPCWYGLEPMAQELEAQLKQAAEVEARKAAEQAAEKARQTAQDLKDKLPPWLR